MIKYELLVVLPCYRDGKRLARYLPGLCFELAAHLPCVQVRIVDDGSPMNERTELSDLITALRRQYDFLEPLTVCAANCGKGSAIQTGWDAGPETKFLAFVDSDGAVPAHEVISFLRHSQEGRAPALHIAERTNRATVERDWFRHAGSRLFNQWVRFWLGLGLPDTQCGLKVIPAAFYRAHHWREKQFAFDLELLLVAQRDGLPIVRRPIAWTEKAGSRLGFRGIISLFAAAVRLRMRSEVALKSPV